MEMHEFIATTTGINFIVRNKMKAAIQSEESEGSKLAALIVLTKDAFIQPAVRNQLRAFWAQNFNGYIEDVAQTAPPEVLGWILSTE